MTLDDVRKKRANILFFGNFVTLDEEDFVTGMSELLVHTEDLYVNMMRDLYSLGGVLSQKVRLAPHLVHDLHVGPDDRSRRLYCRLHFGSDGLHRNEYRAPVAPTAVRQPTSRHQRPGAFFVDSGAAVGRPRNGERLQAGGRHPTVCRPRDGRDSLQPGGPGLPKRPSPERGGDRGAARRTLRILRPGRDPGLP